MHGTKKANGAGTNLHVGSRQITMRIHSKHKAANRTAKRILRDVTQVGLIGQDGAREQILGPNL